MHPASATARFARSYGGQVAGIALTAGAVLSATQSATFRDVLERWTTGVVPIAAAA